MFLKVLGLVLCVIACLIMLFCAVMAFIIAHEEKLLRYSDGEDTESGEREERS